MDLFARIDATAETLRETFGQIPKTAVVLGSGLGGLADALSDATRLETAALPHWSNSSVKGHQSRIIAGKIAGAPLLCLQGRVHLYEGISREAILIPIRALKRAGVERLILTNAAGSTDPAMPTGSIMAIRDYINFSGFNPLIGPNDERFGPRFFDVSEAYDRDLLKLQQQAASAVGEPLYEGSYMMFSGPSFETPAEIRMAQILGARAIGMSTVPETLAARHCGLGVAAFSTITNMAAGLVDGHKLSHQETLTEGAKAAQRLIEIMAQFVGLIQRQADETQGV